MQIRNDIDLNVLWSSEEEDFFFFSHHLESDSSEQGHSRPLEICACGGALCCRLFILSYYRIVPSVSPNEIEYKYANVFVHY